MYDIFQTRDINYNLRLQTDFASNFVNTDRFGHVPWVLYKLKILEVSKYSKQKLEIGSLKLLLLPT